MFLLILKLIFLSLSLYSLLIGTNFVILWLDNKVSLANGKAGYTSAEPILRLAFAKSHNKLKKISFWSKKGVNKYIEHQHNKLKTERYNTALNGVANELTYNLENDTNLKLTNKTWYNGWYLYIPITKEISLNTLLEIESYLGGVILKYTQEFDVDSVTCQRLPNIGWCIVVQLNSSETAKFNRLARRQEVSPPDDFDEDDEVF